MRKEILFFSVIATLVSAHDDISKNGDVVNLYEEGDYRLIEGDILVPKESHLRGSVRYDAKTWPFRKSDGKYIVTYEYSLNFDWTVDDNLQYAMLFYEKHTNLKFERVSLKSKNWLRIVNDKTCYSIVGMQNPAQMFSLNKSCSEIRTVLHELGHALGLNHEHARVDRDDYIQVNYSGYNYSKLPFDNSDLYQITPYDYASIMNYDPNLKTKSTMRLIFTYPEEKYKNVTLAAQIPSTCDMRLLNIMYPGKVKPRHCIPHQPETLYRPNIRNCRVTDTPLEQCIRNCKLYWYRYKYCELPTFEELQAMEPLPQYAYINRRALPYMST